MDSLPPVALSPRETLPAPASNAGRWRAHILRLVIVFLPLGFGVHRANASLWLYKESALAERAIRADAIPRGTVVSLKASQEEGGRIVTEVTFHVQDALKGKLPPEITVRQAGGTVGGIRAEVSGGATFAPGDDSVLFLRHLGNDPTDPHYAVLDRALGKVDVAKDEGGREVVTLLRPELHRADRIPLTDFAERVTSALKGARP